MNERTSPHFASAALITIDVQEDTLDEQPLEIAGTTDAVTRISQLCRAFRAIDRPIIHIVRLYLADGSNKPEQIVQPPTLQLSRRHLTLQSR